MLKNQITETEEQGAVIAFLQSNELSPGTVRVWLDDLWALFQAFLSSNEFRFGMSKRRFSEILSETFKNDYAQKVEGGSKAGMHKLFYMSKALSGGVQ